MSALPDAFSDPDFIQSVDFVKSLFKPVEQRRFAVRFWNGAVWSPMSAGAKPEFTIVLKHPGALRRMFTAPSELNLGEAYIFDDYDLEGSVELAAGLAYRLLNHPRSLAEKLHLHALLCALPSQGRPRQVHAPRLLGQLHSADRDRAAIRYHYDVSNDFYRLFLDSRMLYSAAHFALPDDDLETAQERKLHQICQRLQLKPGERLLDVGCGWGGLVVYAAQKFGVNALGITLSEKQAALASERIREAGIEDRCRVELRDYRELPEVTHFEKIASIGMVEHVGARYLSAYFRAMHRLLTPGGLFLNSGIARPLTEPVRREGSFIEEYVFPDGELETIEQSLQLAEEAGLEFQSAENRRRDYALTLRQWVRRLEAHAEEASHIAGDPTYRTWRLYMAGSAARFAAGELYLLVVLFAKSSSSVNAIRNAELRSVSGG